MFFSTDAGKTWENSTINASYIKSLAFSGEDFFAGAYEGVFHSTDSGKTWANCGLNDEIWSIAIIGKNLFVGTATSGVFRSSDKGLTWSSVNNSLIDKHVHSLVVFERIFLHVHGREFFLQVIMAQVGLSFCRMMKLLHLSFRDRICFAAAYGNGIFLSTT